jgi:hypothetical protein
MTIEVTPQQAEKPMPDWVKRNPQLRDAWHSSLSDRAEMIAADRSVDRGAAILRVMRQIEERYDNC